MHDDTEQRTVDSVPDPTGCPSQTQARWTRLGEHALLLERPPSIRPLREILAEAEALVIYEHWIANGKNTTKTAEALRVSRRRVRKALAAREQAPGSTEAG